jgi:hypothetical protein
MVSLQIERTKVSVPLTSVLSTSVPLTSAPPALSSHSADILLKLNTTPYTWNKEVNLPDSNAPCHKGFKHKGQEHKVLQLRHALYRLNQATIAWWKELDQSMKH